MVKDIEIADLESGNDRGGDGRVPDLPPEPLLDELDRVIAQLIHPFAYLLPCRLKEINGRKRKDEKDGGLREVAQCGMFRFVQSVPVPASDGAPVAPLGRVYVVGVPGPGYTIAQSSGRINARPTRN